MKLSALLAVLLLTLAMLTAVPKASEGVNDGGSPSMAVYVDHRGFSGGFVRAPAVMPVATVTPVSFLATLTFYTCSELEGTADCLTASGTPASPGVAAHATLPFGTKLDVPGFGRYTVSDRGGGLRGNDLDLWAESRAEAFRNGRQVVTVTVEVEP